MSHPNSRDLPSYDMWEQGVSARRYKMWQRAHQGARQALGKDTGDVPPPMPVPDSAHSNWTSVVDTTLDYYGFKLTDVVKLRNRTRAEIICGQELCWRLAKVGHRDGKPLTLMEIGRIVRRDHTSVIHSIKVHARRLAEAEAHVLSGVEDE